MGVMSRETRRRSLSIHPDVEGRLVAAQRKDGSPSFSAWIVGLAVRRANDLGIPETVAPHKPRAVRTRARPRAKPRRGK